MPEEKKSARTRARRRALRAAQVATIALAMTTGGCSSKASAPEVDSGSMDSSAMMGDATTADAARDSLPADAARDATADAAVDGASDAMADAASDATTDSGVADSGVADSGVADSRVADSGVADSGLADGSTCPGVFEPTTPECCAEAGGFWDDSAGRCFIAVPGPFVPPAAAA